MNLLKKSLILFILSILIIGGNSILYGTANNSFSSNLGETTTTSLDKIISSVKNKKNTLGESSYNILTLSIAKKLGYLYDNIILTIDSSSTKNEDFYKDLNANTVKSLDNIIDIVKNKKNTLGDFSYNNLVLQILNRLGYLYNEIAILYSGNQNIPIIDGTSLGGGIGNTSNNNIGEVIDINAIPIDSGFDSNGWPKYLNIPSECPAPEEGKKYSFYSGIETSISGHSLPQDYPGIRPIGPLPLDPSTELQSGFTNVRSYFRQGGNWFQVPLTDDDVVSIPVYFPSVDFEQSLLSAGLNSPVFPPPAFRKLSISYCPGEFGDFSPSTQTGLNMTTPSGQVALKGGCAKNSQDLKLVITDDKLNSIHPAKCLVRPNIRYFINMKNVDSVDSSNKTSCEKAFTTSRSSSKKNGKQVCTAQFVVYGSRSFGTIAPPYTGPCLYKPPYPLNYDSMSCTGARGYPGEFSHLNCDDTWLGGKKLTYNCQDSLGIKPPQTFTMECVNGKLDWTEGKSAPAWSSYVCELSSELEYRTGGYDICNKEKEGQIYDIQCARSLPSSTQNEGFKQCQFDTNTKSYRWVYNYTHMTGFGLNNYKCTAKKYNRTLPDDKCGFNGNTYPIGTVQNIRCIPRPNTFISPSLITMQKECKRTGTVNGQPAIPSFISTSGYESYNMFLLNRNNFQSEGQSSERNGFTAIRKTSQYDCSYTYDTP